ncbi:MAG: hypothetical protein ABIE94_04925 [archaeon]
MIQSKKGQLNIWMKLLIVVIIVAIILAATPQVAKAFHTLFPGG